MRRALVVAALLAGCGGDPAGPEPTASAVPTTSASAAASGISAFPEPPRKVGPGPAPSSESEAMRERVVLGVLQGEIALADVPVEATDDGGWLDPGLRSRLSTTDAQRAPVRLGTVTTTAGLPDAVVRRILRQALGRVRVCYERALAVNPNLIGSLEARFTIAKSGSVHEPTTTGELPSPPMRTCVTSALSGLTFPAPESGAPVAVTAAYTFTPFSR